MATATYFSSGKTVQVEVCCQDMADATYPCTDNEGYGSLFKFDPSYGWSVGCGLHKPTFCPWCGEKLREEG